MSAGVESVALFGFNGDSWGGASVSSGIAPVYGVSSIPRWSTLLADLLAGRMSMPMDFDAIRYMATRCVARSAIQGKRGKACVGVGITQREKIVFVRR